MKNENRTQTVARLGLLFALSIILSFLESLVPLPSMLVGVKLGLSNIVTMYCLFYLGRRYAFTLAVLKGFFAFLTRGVTAGIMSLAGGVMSILFMILLLALFKDKISLTMISVGGGILHNITQLAISCIITGNLYSLYYSPVLLVSGTAAGILTGILLKILMPALKRIKS